MTVNRLVRFPTGEIVEHTKGTYGSRTIPLIPLAAEVIEEIKTHRQEKGLELKGFIFCPNDKPISTYNAIEKAIKKYCRDLGIDERSPHKERKTFTSTLISNGVSINTTRQLAGHVDERTTLNNYCFDRSEDDEKLTQITYALSS
jgi:integrase